MIVSNCSHILNPVLVTGLIEWLACKLGTIVVDGPPADTKSVDDLVFDEVDHINDLNFSKQCNFCSFWEVIGYHKDKPMTFYRWRTDRSYNIDSPCFEWPWSWLWGGVVPGSNISQVGAIVLELWTCLMSSTYAIVGLFKRFSRFRVG